MSVLFPVDSRHRFFRLTWLLSFLLVFAIGLQLAPASWADPQDPQDDSSSAPADPSAPLAPTTPVKEAASPVEAPNPEQRTAVVIHDAKGRTLESRALGSTGNDAGTRKTIPYTAGNNPEDAACGNRPEWADLPCVTRALGQASGHERSRMSDTYSTKRVEAYSMWGDAAVVSEQNTGPVGGQVVTQKRTTTTTFDPSGRVVDVEMTGSGAGLEGTVLDADTTIKKTRAIYDPITGEVVENQALDGQGNVTSRIKKTTDVLGRVTRYEDAHGGWTATEFDRYGNPATVTESTGARRTFTYDREVEPRGFVTKISDSVAGDIIPTYGADGELRSEMLPGDVKLAIDYDATMSPVQRTYTRSDGTVLAASHTVENSFDEVMRHETTASSKSFQYDRAGQLTQVQDRTPGAGTCVQRTYTWDAHANRTAASRTAPSAGCDGVVASEATTYDSLDRIVTTTGPAGAAWTYDPLGRITAAPVDTSSDTVVQNAYFTNDMVAAQQIDGVARQTWALDPLGRLSATTQYAWVDGQWRESVAKVTHFDADGDEAAWVDEDISDPNQITRYVEDVAGNAAVSTGKSGNRELMLTDLQGSIMAYIPLVDGQKTTDATGIRLAASDEFGQVTNLATGTSETTRRGPPNRSERYGWLGAAQRSQEALAGITLMGMRMYQPMTGRFLSVDSEPAGNATPYDYCSGDPVGCTDLSGQGFWSSFKKAIKKYAPIIAKVTEVASYIPGPIGTAAGAISGAAYLASGNKSKATEMFVGAAANMVPGGKVASKLLITGGKSLTKSPKLGRAFSGISATSRRGKSVCSRNSFAAGTYVLLADGSRVRIEDLTSGDEVISIDPITGEATSEVVLDLIVGHGTKHLLEITLDQGMRPITATANHPVWVEGKGWILAEQLQAGDHMRGATGGIVLVREVHDTGWLSGQTVYNLHVTGPSHTYAVANGLFDDPVVVHNDSGCPEIGKYSKMRKLTRGKGGAEQAHHLVEKRFQYKFTTANKEWDSVVLTREEHQEVTNAWRRAIPYGKKVSVGKIKKVAKQINRRKGIAGSDHAPKD